MQRLFNFTLVSLVFAFLVAGCADTDEPKPGDTVLGSPSRPANSGVWINPEDTVYGGQAGDFAGGDGLEARGGNFNALDGGDPALGGIGGQNVMESIYFGFDQTGIQPGERSKLEQAAATLRSNPGSRLIAEGHTDKVGTTEYNLGLSDRRANSVKSYLEQLGIPGDRVEILAMGELEADQDAAKGSEAARLDRRVDIILVR